MASNIKLKNANGINAEVTLVNPDSNIDRKKEVDVSKLIEENDISGTFTTTDGKTITVSNGIITNIS